MPRALTSEARDLAWSGNVHSSQPTAKIPSRTERCVILSAIGFTFWPTTNARASSTWVSPATYPAARGNTKRNSILDLRAVTTSTGSFITTLYLHLRRHSLYCLRHWCRSNCHFRRNWKTQTRREKRRRLSSRCGPPCVRYIIPRPILSTAIQLDQS